MVSLANMLTSATTGRVPRSLVGWASDANATFRALINNDFYNEHSWDLRTTQSAMFALGGRLVIVSQTGRVTGCKYDAWQLLAGSYWIGRSTVAICKARQRLGHGYPRA